jgi:2,4-diketo-3-deoxy-L-fuconate hydrolase
MKLIRFGDPGLEKPGIQLDDTCVDVSDFVRDYDESFFSNDGLVQLEDWFRLNRTSANPVPPSVRLGSPICRPKALTREK